MKKALGCFSLLLAGGAFLLQRHRDAFDESVARLRVAWASYDEGAQEFRGMEFWTPHQLALCDQEHYLDKPSAQLKLPNPLCYSLTTLGIVPVELEVLNEYPVVVIFHRAVPRRLLRELDHHSSGSNASRDLFDPYKLSGLLDGARIVNQRHIPHRLNPAVESVTNLTEALTGLDLDCSSQEWKLVSYGAGFHHSLHTDFLFQPKPVQAKTAKEVLAEAQAFFKRRCLENTRHVAHLALCALKTLSGGLQNYFAPVQIENESFRTVKTMGNRAFAVIVYSNEGYVGGKTIFPSLNITVQGAEGDLLAFPISTPDSTMDQDMMHAACPLKEGRKVVSVYMPRERGQELRLLCPWDVNAYDLSSFTRGPVAQLFGPPDYRTVL